MAVRLLVLLAGLDEGERMELDTVHIIPFPFGLNQVRFSLAQIQTNLHIL